MNMQCGLSNAAEDTQAEGNVRTAHQTLFLKSKVVSRKPKIDYLKIDVERESSWNPCWERLTQMK
jgi:hypothetical protein